MSNPYTTLDLAPPDALDGFDLRALPDDFYDNPFPLYHRLRHDTPVRTMPDGSILLTRHADLWRIYRDTETFSSDKKIEFRPKYGESPLFDHHTTSLVFNDPPLHTRVRKPIAGALAPRALVPMRPNVEALVTRLVDGLRGRETVDAVTDFASEIPIQVIGDLLLIPLDERGPLRDWSLAILGALEPALTADQMARGNRAVTDFLAYLERHIATLKASGKTGGDDIMSRLLATVGTDDGLTHHELLQNCIFILNAGHETTTNVIASGIWLLATRADDVARLNAAPELWPDAVEEVLRAESPNQLGNRRAVAAFEIDGVRYPEGTMITLGIGAANRDPAVFDGPDTFRLDRVRNPHLAFAAGGHVCAGMTVARIEAEIALSRLFAAFPGLRLAGPPRRARRARFRGFDALPIAL